MLRLTRKVALHYLSDNISIYDKKLLHLQYVTTQNQIQFLSSVFQHLGCLCILSLLLSGRGSVKQVEHVLIIDLFAEKSCRYTVKSLGLFYELFIGVWFFECAYEHPLCEAMAGS